MRPRYVHRMWKWLNKGSEVLCEAVIRLNYKGPGAWLLSSLCSVVLSFLLVDLKYDQVEAHIHKLPAENQSQAEKQEMGINVARARLHWH